MKNKLILLQIMILFCWAPVTGARNTINHFSIQDAMKTPEAVGKLNQDISFYFGDQKHPKVAERYGTFTTNKKTNALGKSDLEACQWVFLSAMIALQERVIREGGNALINIKSYYKSKEFSSATEFECGAGAFVAGVALRGEVVTLTK